MDAIRIITAQSGKRKGRLISTAVENSNELTEQDILIYRINKRCWIVER
jgi:hypothetical protein